MRNKKHTIGGITGCGSESLSRHATGIATTDANTRFFVDGRDADVCYTLKPSDNGKVIKVRVTFTDDAGNEETLTSEGTSAVVMGGL